jgi:polar amino acid transport system substrate-binding protein
MGVRKGDTAMLNQVNKVLDGMEASGQAAKLFDKWFGAGTQFNLKRDFRIEAIKG